MDSIKEKLCQWQIIISEPESKEEVVIPEKEAAQPAPTPAPAVEPINYNASNILKNNYVEKILAGRTLLRIYSASYKVDSPELYVHIEKDVVSQYYMKYADK